MNKSTVNLEKRRLQSVAREYRRKGYRVLLSPSESDLPSFLSGFRPDMIALGEEENVVVEVKSKATLSKTSYLTALTDAVKAHPQWRFELVVTNPASPEIVEKSAEVLSPSEIEARIRSVRQLLEGDQEEAAIVLAWSATEAVLRFLAQEQGIESRKSVLELIKELYSLGIIDQADYDLLQEGIQYRNVIAHGFRSVEPTTWLVERLLQATEKLLTVKEVFPHQVFRLDFDTMLEEGRRQEQIDPSNKGEYDLVRSIHSYFSDVVLPLVNQNDWVFEAASKLAAEYIDAYYQCIRLSSKEAFETQTRLHKLKEDISDFVRRHPPKALTGKTLSLAKASDFIELIELEKLNKQARAEATRLFEQARDHETVQLTVTLRNIRDSYEMGLPRVMFVVQRAIKVRQGIRSTSSDDDLQQPSNYIDWFKNHTDNHHPLYPILGNQGLIEFYRVARNVASHHTGLRWEPESDQVILEDRTAVLSVQIQEFQQRYRYLVYLSDYGLRGISSAFCERERGAAADRLLNEYNRTFPKDFPVSEQAKIRYYSSVPMVKVVFRDWVNSPDPTAKGTLDIPGGKSIGQCIGSLVPFAITTYYADLPLGPSGEGVVAEIGDPEYYEFKVVEISEDRSSGHLRILSRAKK